MRVAFLGNDAWSVPSLLRLADEPRQDVVLVVTNPPRPAGRRSVLRRTPVAVAAESRGLVLVEAARAREGSGFQALRSSEPDVIAVVAYGELLTPNVLNLPPLGAINLHFSLLPRWRGAAPVQHALLAGDPSTGVTVMEMDEGMDTGPILRQREEPILPDDDAGTLGARLAEVGAELLVGTLNDLEGLDPRRQDPALATSAPKLGAGERVLDWGEAASSIVQRVRALAPEPAAATRFRGEPLKVFRVDEVPGRVDEVPSRGAPGRIVDVDERGVVVASADGAVRLREVAPAGRRRMAATAWARGARFSVGERLG